MSAFQARFAASLANRPGLHSGVIAADDRTTRDPADLEILNTVVTPYTFSAANDHSRHLTGRIEAEKIERFFFRVPEGTGALELTALSRAAERAGLVVYVINPLGVPQVTNTDAFVPAGGQRDHRQPGGRHLGGRPARPRAAIPGVSERPRSHPVRPFHSYDLTVKLLSVALDPASWTVDPATPGQTATQAFTATNNGAVFTGKGSGTALVQSARERKTIAADAGEQRYPVEVPAGTTELVVKISNPSDQGADLDLLVYDLSGELFALDADGDSDETVTVANPAAGTWQAGVDPFEVLGLDPVRLPGRPGHAWAGGDHHRRRGGRAGHRVELELHRLGDSSGRTAARRLGVRGAGHGGGRDRGRGQLGTCDPEVLTEY